MKNLNLFLLSLLVAGCCSTVKETERNVTINVDVPEIHKTLPAVINDSTIIAEDTTAYVQLYFVINDTVKSDSAKKEIKMQVKSALKTLTNLPVKPQVDLKVKPDSVHASVKVKDIVIEKGVDFYRYIEIAAVGFVICIFTVIFIAIVIKR